MEVDVPIFVRKCSSIAVLERVILCESPRDLDPRLRTSEEVGNSVDLGPLRRKVRIDVEVFDVAL
jgi:hypothetical protein